MKRLRILMPVLATLALLVSMIGMALPAAAAQITATKDITPAGTNMYHVGDTIHYVMTVSNPASNTGVTNTLTDIHDHLPNGTIVYFVEPGVDPPLIQAPGDSETFTLDYVVTAADVVVLAGAPPPTGFGGLRGVINAFHATGFDSNGDNLTATVEKNSRVLEPAIAVTKSANPTVSKAGDVVTYTISINNTSIDTPLSSITVNDSLLGDLSGSFADNLTAGASESHTFTRTVLAADPDPVVNTVTVTGMDQLALAVTATASASVDLVHPNYTLTKTASPTTASTGTVITYTYVITNTGDVTLNRISAIDDVLGTLTADFPATLASGATVTVTETRAILAGDPNPLVNIITTIYQVAGLPNQLTRTATASVAIANPAIAVTKTANPLVSKAGDVVTYTINVTNTGNVALSGITVIDSLLGDLSGSFADTLAVGASESHTFTRTVLAGDLDPLVNTVTVSGSFGAVTVTATASATVDLVHPNYTLTKTASPTSGNVGTVITYTYVITNTGDVQLNRISAIDDVLGDLTADFPATLASGATVTVTETRAILAGDPNPLVNIITTIYQVAGLPNQLTRTATASVEVIGQEGCTPGFWKTNAINWDAVAWEVYTPGQTLESVFDVPNSLGLDNTTLLQALQFKGGNGVDGAAQILLRAAVAALLNSTNSNINYPLSTAEVISQVNTALASLDRSTILALATTLDNYNNLGCSINQKGEPIIPEIS